MSYCHNCDQLTELEGSAYCDACLEEMNEEKGSYEE